MQQILLTLKQGLRQKVFVLSLMMFISLSNLLILFAQPSYAITAPRDQLTQEDKIERAYEFREGAGILEEDKQASNSRNQLFQPKDKANEKSVKASKEANNPLNLLEKAQELVEKVTGKE